jgi:hypothetical protein
LVVLQETPLVVEVLRLCQSCAQMFTAWQHLTVIFAIAAQHFMPDGSATFLHVQMQYVLATVLCASAALGR